jgi:hypothetical protein
VNYLDVARGAGSLATSELLVHKRRLVEQLARQAQSPTVWDKYRWLSDYHNWFCARRFRSAQQLLVTNNQTTTLFSRV